MEETINFYAKRGRIKTGLIILLIITFLCSFAIYYQYPNWISETASVKSKICLYSIPFILLLLFISIVLVSRTFYVLVLKGQPILMLTPKELRIYNSIFADYICVLWTDITGIYRNKDFRSNIITYTVNVKDRDSLLARQGIKKNWLYRINYITNSNVLTSFIINSIDIKEEDLLHAFKEKNNIHIK